MTLLSWFLRLCFLSPLFHQLVDAFHFELPPNPCLSSDLNWFRDAGDPQDILLFWQDVVQNLKIPILLPLLSADKGQFSLPFIQPGTFAILAEALNGSLISSCPVDVPDCGNETTSAGATSSSPVPAASVSAASLVTSVHSQSAESSTATSSSSNWTLTSSSSLQESTPISTNTVTTTTMSCLGLPFPIPSISLGLDLDLPHVTLDTGCLPIPGPSQHSSTMLSTSAGSAASSSTSSRGHGIISPTSGTSEPTMTITPTNTPSASTSSRGNGPNVPTSGTSEPTITITPTNTPESTDVSMGSSPIRTSSFSPTVTEQAGSTVLETSSDQITFSSSDFGNYMVTSTNGPNIVSPAFDLSTSTEQSVPTTSVTGATTVSFTSTARVSLPPTPLVTTIPSISSSATSQDPSTSTSQPIQQTMSQPGAIAGVTIGAVILAVVTSLLVASCMIKRRRQQRYNDRASRKMLNPFLYHAVGSSSSGSQHGGQTRERSTIDPEMATDPEFALLRERMSEADIQPSSQRGRRWDWKAQLRKWRSSIGVIEPFIIPRTSPRPSVDMREENRERARPTDPSASLPSRWHTFDEENAGNDHLPQMQEQRLFLRNSSVLSVATATTARMSSVMTRSAPSDAEYQINRVHGPLGQHPHVHQNYRAESPSYGSVHSRYYPDSSSNSRERGTTTTTATATTSSSKADYQTAFPYDETPEMGPSHPRSLLPSYKSYNSPLAMASSEPPQLKRISFTSTWANDPFLTNQEIERLAADEQEADWAMEGFLERIPPDDLPPAYDGRKAEND
ncbi:hypothetical protein EV361DRAFT_950102 [Lentinula raphanica]|nr:hypothetical protein EV361DRAFT_950102 [Lentinula raphanica]